MQSAWNKEENSARKPLIPPIVSLCQFALFGMRQVKCESKNKVYLASINLMNMYIWNDSDIELWSNERMEGMIFVMKQ